MGLGKKPSPTANPASGSRKRQKKEPKLVELPPKPDPPKPLTTAQKEVGESISQAVLDTKEGAYLVAPPGVGKTHCLNKLFLECEEGKPALNIVVAPSKMLLKEMKPKLPEISIHDFGGKRDKEKLKAYLEVAKEGDAVSISITHTYLRSLLSPREGAEEEDEGEEGEEGAAGDATVQGSLADLLDAVGKPKKVMLIIDEAHNLCANSKWADKLKSAKATLTSTKFRVVLVSATPKLDIKRYLQATLTMLGGRKKAMDEDVLRETALVEYTDEQVARFKAETSSLPAPGGWIVEQLAPAYPNEAMARVEDFDELLEELTTLTLGDMLCKLKFQHDKRDDPKKVAKLDICAINAKKNLIDAILARMVHHGRDDGAANGGELFAKFADKVPTFKVKDGKTDARKKKDASECMLLVHPTARGVAEHYALLDTLHDKGASTNWNGISEFNEPNCMHRGEINAAKDDSEFAKFLSSFNMQEHGVTIGMVTPKQAEGTDKFNAVVTKAVLVGPSDDKIKQQIAGRFDRPCKLEEGQRVRKDATVLIHFDSAWAQTVDGLISTKGSCDLGGVDGGVSEELKKVGDGLADQPTAVMLAKFIVNLERSPSLLPFKHLTDVGLSHELLRLVKDEDDWADFIHRGDRVKRGENKGDLLEGEHDGFYFETVNKWVKNDVVVE